MDTERIIGTFLDSLLTQEDFTKFQQKFMAAVSGQTTIREQIKLSLNGEEFWFDSAIVPIYVDNNKPDQVIWYAKDITDLIEIHHELQKKGAMQIEKNMEQFQILNDQIRNPLTVIASLASMEEGQYTDKILEHVKKIDDLVNQLDRGWIESNKIRSYFLRHYKHGEEFWT